MEELERELEEELEGDEGAGAGRMLEEGDVGGSWKRS